MPLQYSGVVDEHTAVRERVGLFDGQPPGQDGHRLRARLRRRLPDQRTGQDRARPGAVHVVLRRRDRRDRRRPHRVPALRRRPAADPERGQLRRGGRRLSEVAPAGVEVRDVHREYAVLAVQGTRSDETLRTLGLPTDRDYMAFDVASWEGTTVTVCRTGYTGERGYELVVPGRRRGRLGCVARRRVRRTASRSRARGRETRCAPRWAIRCTADPSLDISPVQARGLGRRGGTSRRSGT